MTGKKLDYKALLSQDAIIIDVRTPQEFAQGHVANSINIPINEVPNRIADINKMDKPIIACCRSGARSNRASKMLQKANIEAYNGGGWKQVETAINEVK